MIRSTPIQNQVPTLSLKLVSDTSISVLYSWVARPNISCVYVVDSMDRLNCQSTSRVIDIEVVRDIKVNHTTPYSRYRLGDRKLRRCLR